MVTPSSPLPDWLRTLYPFERRDFLTPSGARMNYLDEGPRRADDEAILMLHGNPTWSFFYRDLIRTLSSSWRCVAPDHIGMGLSEKPQDYDYSLERRISDLEALVSKLGLRRIHLVVHDWGGAIGFGLAARQPELIGRIVILNTAAFPSSQIPLRISACRAPGIGEWLVRGLNGFAGPATTMAMSRRRLSETEKRGFLYPYGTWADRVAVHRFVRDIPLETNHPSRATLETIGAALPRFSPNPKMILWGGCDFCFNDHFLARWRQIYPQAPVHRYDDVGHYVLEDAGQDAWQRIASFFQTPAS